MTTDKTDRLTQEELDFKKRVRPTNDLQRAVLAASIRTGVRYGVSVGKGVYHLVVTSYRLNGKGRAVGSADVETLDTFLVEHEVALIGALNAL